MPTDELLTKSAHPSDASYRSLVEAIAGGAALFVGAGSSRKVGYPTWGELLSELAAAARVLNAARVEEVEGVDHLSQASAYKEVLGAGSYHRVICEVFAPRTPPHDAVHESLVDIPFRHVLTTNYDGVLQSAHRVVFGASADGFDADESVKLAEFWTRHQELPRSYVHLHGSIGRPEGIVLCREEYDQRYHRDRRFEDFLRGFLSSNRLVFAGFSLSDHDFTYILDQARAIWTPGGPRHFALLPARADAQQQRVDAADLRNRVGIEPVFFDNSSGDYSGLWSLVGRLQADVAARIRATKQANAATLQSLLADALSPDPDRQRTARDSLPKLFSRHGVAMSLRDVGDESDSVTDRDIEAAFKLVARGLPDDAIAEFEAIRTRVGNRLTSRQRYRIEANIGNALYSKEEFELASRAYLLAVGHFNKTKEAQGIELLGKHLAGLHSEARALALDLCAREPMYGRAWAILVRSHEPPIDFASIEAAVPAAMREDAEVALALSDCAARCGNLDAHVRHARVAATASPDWPDALAMLGAAIITSERRFATYHADRGLVPAKPDLIVEAEDAMSKAIAAIGSRDPANRLSGLYFNRSVARRFLGRAADATRDVREAFRLDPSEPVIAIGFSFEAEAQLEMDAAFSALSSLPLDGEWADQVQLALVMLLLRRGKEGDAELARREVDRLCARLGSVMPESHRADIVRVALQVCRRQERDGDGVEILAGLPAGALPGHLRSMWLARAHLQAGAREVAMRVASEAVREMSGSESWSDRRDAALLAQECGLHSDAVRLWRTLIAPGEVVSDTLHLICAAYSAGDWRTVLDECASVRLAGRTTWDHLVYEIRVLEGVREVTRATELVRDWVATHPDDKHAVLCMSALALRDGRPESAVFDETRLPSVLEARSPGEGAVLVAVLRRGPHAERALEVAYALYRRFPESRDTHQALVECVFARALPPLDIKRHQRVEDGAAVHVCRRGDPPMWVYVESGAEPIASREEFAESHAFVRAMWGLSAGDKFEYLAHQYEVLGVENRMLRRVHDIMERFEVNFPDGPAIRRLTVPSTHQPDASIEASLGDVYKLLDAQDRGVELLLSNYRTGHWPITTLAKELGRGVIDVVTKLASDRTLGVRAHNGDDARWETALGLAMRCDEVVLDGTVLAAALRLGMLAELPNLGVKLVVPRSLLDELREMQVGAMGLSGPRRTIGLHRGKLLVHEPSPQQCAEEASRIESLIEFVSSQCEVIGGESTIDLQAELREKLSVLLSDTTIYAVALAKSRGAVLWTDDCGLESVLWELGVDVRVVWTQAVVRAARDRLRVSNVTYLHLLCRLVESGYSCTLLTASEMVAILRLAHWRVDCSSGETMVRVVSEAALASPRSRSIAALCIWGVWTECPQRRLAKAITVAILGRIGHKQSQKWLAALIYRSQWGRDGDVRRGVSGAGLDGAGSEMGTARSTMGAEYTFCGRPGRALKRFLRSWRSQCGEFKPRRTRARRG